MNKHQRALHAARAAKRIPIVGTTVTLLPVAEAAAASGIGTRFMTSAGWRDFANELKFRYFGTDTSGNVNGQQVAATWIPIVAYIASYKLGIAKYPSKILSKIGLRF